MTREQALAELKELQQSGDTEAAHAKADMVMYRMLVALGYEDVADTWAAVDKWYA